MSHALISLVEAYGILAALIPLATVVGLLGIVALVVRFPRDRALTTYRSDW